MKIVISFQERPSNPGEQAWLMRAEEVRSEGVYDAPDGCIACVIRLRVIAAMGAQFLHFLGLQAEDKNIFLTDLPMISILAPSSVPMVRAPFIANFMLLVPEASVPAVEMCSLRSAAGMIFSARSTR